MQSVLSTVSAPASGLQNAGVGVDFHSVGIVNTSRLGDRTLARRGLMRKEDRRHANDAAVG